MLFFTIMKSIVLCINIEDRRQKAKELVLEIATLPFVKKKKMCLLKMFLCLTFIDSKRAKANIAKSRFSNLPQ